MPPLSRTGKCRRWASVAPLTALCVLAAGVAAQGAEAGGGGSAFQGTVRDYQGNPLEGVTVEADDGMGTSQATTNASGVYDLPVPGANGYTLTFSKTNYVTVTRQASVGAEPVTYNVKMTTPAFAATLEGTVTGQVGGAPVQGASVDLRDQEGNLVDEDTTDGGGDYSFTQLTPDTYAVHVAATGFEPFDADRAVQPLVANIFDIELLPEGFVPPDTDPPGTTIGKAPRRRTHRRRLSFSFSSDEPGSTFECSLDRRPFKACTSPKRYRVRPGRHRFRVRAFDEAGNVDGSPAVKRLRVLA